MSPADEEEKVWVNFDLSESTHRRLKAHAAVNGTTITEILTAYVESLVLLMGNLSSEVRFSDSRKRTPR